MKLSIRQARVLACAAFACLASAQAFATDTLSYVSEAGDYIGQGQTKSFSGDFFDGASLDNRSVLIYFTDNSNSYSLRMGAPLGQQLLPGVYPNAQRFGRDYGNTLEFFGEARGCETTGNFTVHEAVYGPFGYIEKFHASWEQHCGPTAPGLFGEVYISNPPPPPAITIEVAVDSDAKIKSSNGVVTLTGTIKCSQEAGAIVWAEMSQYTGNKKLAYTYEGHDVACHTATSRWSFDVTPVDYGNEYKFSPGVASLNTRAVVVDPHYQQPVEVASSSVVKLKPSN
jgi:hypothetical protein